MIGEQPGGQLPVPRRLGVTDRLHWEPMADVPPGGHPVQLADLIRRRAAQLQLQQAGEQPMVAEAGPRRVQRHHERVRLLQVLQDPLPARTPRQRIGQLAADPLQYRGPQQQPPHLLALPLQHLGQQVLRHRPLAAGELVREPLRVRVPGQRQDRQPQPRRPPLGPLMQQRQRRLRQLHPGPLEQCPRLTQREPQIVRPDLGQLTLQPQPVQPEPHVVPGGQHEPQLRRGPHQQQLQLPQRLGRAQLVHVVHHQPEPVFQCRQVLQHAFHDRPPVQVRRRRHRLHQP